MLQIARALVQNTEFSAHVSGPESALDVSIMRRQQHSTMPTKSTLALLSHMKMVLKFPKPKAAKVDPKRTLLQIVDMQEEFVGLENRKTMWQPAMHISSIKALLEKARELEMIVVFQYSTSIRNPYEKKSKPFRSEPSFGRIIDDIRPVDRPSEYIVSKTTHDIFFHTHMDELLKKLSNVDTVIVTGTVTNVCVLYTVSGYCIRGYRVIVPMDAVIARRPQDQAATFHVIGMHSPYFPATLTLSGRITFVK